ncbi:MAG TPA: hypothetical protein VF115_11305 [Acidimicrobiia bacterium]
MGAGIATETGGPDIAEIHDFDDTVIAVLDDASNAVPELRSAGYEVEVLEGASGKEHLDPAGESGGAVSTVKRLLNAFGDQYRVLEHLYDELDAGKQVVSVDASPDEADEAIRVLQENDGKYIWKFGTWTYTEIGD